MRPILFAFLAAVSFGAPAFAQPAPFPKSFRTQEITANGATLHVRVGGQGPAVVLLHGYGETGDMWSPLAADLARDHRVVVPDLRGLGLSSRPADGYDKKTQAGDVATASLLEVWIDEAERRVWFLFEASRRADTPGR